jgi:presequence protease
LPNWIYEKNPFDGVRFEEALQGLKDDLASGKPVFQELLKKYLVENTHRLRAEAIPDSQLESKQQEEERQRLERVKSSLSSEQIESIVSSSEVLRQAQLKEDSPEAKATIPRLSLEDIDRKNKEVPIAVETIPEHNVKLVTHDIQSNGILYTDIAFDMSAISFEDLPYLPLFVRMLTEAGTATYDEVALSRKIGSQTGGISTSMHTDIKHFPNGEISTGDDALFYLVVRGKATEAKVPIMLNLMSDMLLNSKLSNQRRAVEILRESKARKESAVITSGHSFAATRLAARHSFLGYVSEQLSGVTSVRQAGVMLQTAEKNWPEIEARLMSIRDKIVNKKNVLINLTAAQTLLDSSRPAISSFLSTLPESSGSTSTTIQSEWKQQKSSKLLPMINEGFSVPSQVNYVLKGGPIFSPGEKVSSSFKVITRYLSNSYLWDNVRVVGGAYGGFAQFSDVSGRLSFASYRDPNLLKTLEVYDNAPKALDPEEIPPESLKDSIIGTIGDMDSPQSPDQKGDSHLCCLFNLCSPIFCIGYGSFLEYLAGDSPEDRQRVRDQVLSTGIDDVKDYVKRLSDFPKKASVVVFGSQSALEQANKELAEPLKIESAIQAQTQA